MKDDSGSCAAFTEQSSSASQMTAATVMDVVARLPDCGGQAADAVSAYTQEKWRTMIAVSKIRMSRSLETSTTAQVAQIMVQH